MFTKISDFDDRVLVLTKVDPHSKYALHLTFGVRFYKVFGLDHC